MYHVAIQYEDTMDIVPITINDIERAEALRDTYVDKFREDKSDHGALSVMIIQGEREWV